jgi:hypothetical protein
MLSSSSHHHPTEKKEKEKPEKHEYKLKSVTGKTLGTFQGTTAYQAAKKATTKILRDGEVGQLFLQRHYGHNKLSPRIHTFRGHLSPLDSKKRTKFAQDRGITHVPKVERIGTIQRSNTTKSVKSKSTCS